MLQAASRTRDRPATMVKVLLEAFENMSVEGVKSKTVEGIWCAPMPTEERGGYRWRVVCGMRGYRIFRYQN